MNFEPSYTAETDVELAFPHARDHYVNAHWLDGTVERSSDHNTRIAADMMADAQNYESERIFRGESV